MNYLELMKTSAEKFNSIVSLGLDPVIEEMPIKKGTEAEKIFSFYESILNSIVKHKVYPGAVKPNYAFYAQYGLSGIEALSKIIKIYKAEKIPVILDVKRGDISKTALAYAKECFEFFKADSVTLAPYMGYDSISPFIESYPDKGYYILNKTSNKSSKDIQDILLNNSKPVYMHVAEKILDWYHPGIGAVIGATFVSELADICKIFNSSGKEIPLLIPGVGTQGGKLEDIIPVLKQTSDIKIHRINSSSQINYAYKNYKHLSFSDAAVEELKKLNDNINMLC